jgi:hypothetical protein
VEYLFHLTAINYIFFQETKWKLDNTHINYLSIKKRENAANLGESISIGDDK